MSLTEVKLLLEQDADNEELVQSITRLGSDLSSYSDQDLSDCIKTSSD